MKSTLTFIPTRILTAIIADWRPPDSSLESQRYALLYVHGSCSPNIAQAPFFAGCAFLFSGWYTRKELGLRLGIFFCSAMVAGAFGGLFAAGIAAAFENNDIASWRWLFIIEGAATVVFAIITGFVIPDWPATTKWLSEEEKALGIMRIVEDAGSEEEDISTMTAFKLAAKDHRIWLCVLGQMCLQAVAVCSPFRQLELPLSASANP